MAGLQKFLALIGGRSQQVSPLQVSAGATSAGAIAALDAAGVFDPSLFAAVALDVSNGTGVGSPPTIAFTASSNGFNTTPFSTVNVDTASGWNTGTNEYTVPYTGLYLLVSKFRPQDDNPGVSIPPFSFGQGVNLNNNVDGPWFLWANTSSGASGGYNRNGTVNTRLLHCTAGQKLNAYYYVDSSSSQPILETSLNIVLLK